MHHQHAFQLPRLRVCLMLTVSLLENMSCLKGVSFILQFAITSYREVDTVIVVSSHY